MQISPQRHNLARLRLFLGLTQRKMAEVAGCSVPTVRAVELGKLKLSPGLAQKISIATGISASWLLDNDLDAPLVNREGTPFLIEQYAVARIKEAGPTVYGWTSETRQYPELMMAALGRLSAIFYGLCLTNSNDYLMAKWKLEEFIQELEASYGEAIPSDLKEQFADNSNFYNGDVLMGMAKAQDIVKELTSPVYMLFKKKNKNIDSQMDEAVAGLVAMKCRDSRRISGAIESTRIELKHMRETHLNSPPPEELLQNTSEYFEERDRKIEENKAKILALNEEIKARQNRSAKQDEQIRMLEEQIRIKETQEASVISTPSQSRPRKKKS